METTDVKFRSFVAEDILRKQTLRNVYTPKLIEYKQMTIVYIDFSYMKNREEIYTAIDVAGAFIRRHPLKSLFVLTNISGMFYNNEVFNHLTAYAKANTPHVRASAVVGMAGMMQIFYNGFTRLTGREVKAFTTEIEAKEYLLAQSKNPVI